MILTSNLSNIIVYLFNTYIYATALIVSNFYFHFVIGRGGFGKVWKVESKKTKQVYALKEMGKAK